MALLDRLAPLRARAARLDAGELPLASVLEGGTWAAGRAPRRERRARRPPPIRVESDGTVI